MHFCQKSNTPNQSRAHVGPLACAFPSRPAARRCGTVLLWMATTITLLPLACTSSPPAWLQKLKPQSTRFKVPVMVIPKADREQSLALSRRLAQEWSARTKLQTFVDDQLIREQLLAKGELIPSTNYSITSKAFDLGGKMMVTLSVQNLETGQVLSSTRMTGQSHQDLHEAIPGAVKDLLQP